MTLAQADHGEIIRLQMNIGESKGEVRKLSSKGVSYNPSTDRGNRKDFYLLQVSLFLRDTL